MSDEALNIPLSIDLGKTSCRIRITVGGRDYSSEGPGAPGLASSDGLDRAIAAIAAASADLPSEALEALDCVGVGAAGVDANRENAAAMARHLSRVFRAPAAIASDVLTAHLGALGGEPGAVLVAGTGAVAIGIDAAGTIIRTDGWGPWLGDDGSGRWIGQEGLKRALRAHDGRGPQTSLLAAAAAAAGSAERLPVYVAGGGEAERVLASFAPIVLAEARAGDVVASSIISEALTLLADAAAVAAGPHAEVALLGGLVSDEYFAERLRAAIGERRVTSLAARGDALAGAALIARRTDLPHERYVIRARTD